MDTKKLRQKILDLAIHGKLVPQDPNDEPASVLLERIRAEKERLIAEGKIKRSKKSATSDTSHYENVPFEIPDGWRWCTLDDFAYVAAGSTPNKDAFVDEGIPYIKMYNLRNQKIDFDFHPQYIKEDVHNGKLQRSRTEVGDLIMNIVGPPLGKLAFIPESLPQSNFNQAAVLIRPYIEKNTINRWLFYYLSEMSEINSISTKGSAGQVNISLTQSQNMRVPMPPLAEQIRIVNKLDSLWNITEGIESGIKDVNCVINKFKSKILDLAIHGKLVPQDASDEPASELLKRINPKAVASCDNPHYEQIPFEIPDNWVWVKIDEINKFKSKTVNPQNSPTDQFELYSVPTFETGEPEFPYGKDVASSKVEVEEGDVLLCKINPHLNRVWRVKRRMAQMKLLASSEWIVIRANEIIPEYLVLTMQSPYFRELMMSNVSGVGGSLMRAQPTYVKQYMIPIPPMQEQKRIVEKIQETFYMLHSIADSLN